MRDFSFVNSSSSANSNHSSDNTRQRHYHHRPRQENNTNFRINNSNMSNGQRANFHVKSNNIELDHTIESHQPQEPIVFFSQRVPQDIPRTFSNQLPPTYNHHKSNTSQVLPSSSSKNIQEAKPGQNQRRRSPYLREKEEPETSTSHLPSQHKILRLSKKFDLVEFARNQRRNHIGRNFAVVRNCLPENQLIPILPSSLVGQFP